MSRTVSVEAGRTRATLCAETGRLLHLVDLLDGTDLIGEQRLVENWRILVPLPERRHHYVVGSDQTGCRVAEIDGGVELHWSGLSSPAAGTLAVDLTQRWQRSGDGIEVTTTVVNRGGHVVEEVLSPVLGGLARPADEGWRLHHPGPLGPGEEFEAFRVFPGTYLGPRRPVWQLPYHTRAGMPWVDLYQPERRRGLYLGVHDPEGAHAVFRLELTPGSVWRGDEQVWPDPSVLGPDEPVGMAGSWSTFPFLQSGAEWTSPPVVVRVHDGIWWEAARVFRAWWDDNFALAPRSWLAEEDAWQSTIISYPDGDVGYRYSDLPQLAAAALGAGIRVIQICGWHRGGLDRNYPDYDVDPRLGTEAEFVEAIAECERMGVRVLVFANLQVANVETERWPSLSSYAIQDPHGTPYNTVSWDYNTTTGLEQLSGYRMAWMNPAHPEFRELWLEQMRKVVALGGSGIQVDKLLGGGFHGMDYNPSAPGGGPATTLAAGLQTALQELLDLGRSRRDDFCLAAESHWDRAARSTNASYARYFSGRHLPTFAAAFPEQRQTCAVTGPHDFGLVNNAIRYGHVISLEPVWMHGDADDVPILRDHVGRALALRRRLRGEIWDSRLVDPHDWTLDNETVEHCAHESLTHGRQSLVLTHFATEPQTVTVAQRGNRIGFDVHRLDGTVERVGVDRTIALGVDEVVVLTAPTGREP